MHFLPGLSTAIVSLIVVTYYEWRISLSILLAFIPYVLINRWRFQRNSQLERQEYKLFDKQYSHFWEVLSSMSLIKSFRSEKFEIRKLKQFYDQILELRKEMERNTNRALGGDLFLESWNWAMYAYIVWLAYSGDITVGTMVLLVGMIKLIREPLWQLNWIFWEVKRAGIGARDFFRIMDVQPEICDPENPVTLPKVKGEIKFHDVKFIYKNTGPLPNIMLEDEELPAKDLTQGPQTVFDGVTFTLEAGKTTALVGPSGSGKTTVGALILRYFDPESGHITLDGVDIRQLRQSDIRGEIGLVSQDPFLFAESITENLRYAKPDATLEEMLAACKAAYALEFIEKLPAGLDTKIGDRGVKLSGGQRQRLSLARTILRNPKIIVLDEATSALDSESEMYIQRALAEILKNRTALVIAHRLSTIQRADKIIVLKDKKVLEEGSHAELLKKNNLYASLFKIQSGHAETLKEWELVA
jgi:ABC-type multidrug transport system fused ATPase/permease subunit